jgi:hypothetical protein
MSTTDITAADILPLAEFAKVRAEKRKEVVAHKRNRRMEIGPVATFYFESYLTMWWQIHEMLFIEKGGDEQVADEIAAYNPLVPKGRELVCTIMFEIDDEIRRRNFLSKLGGIEEKVFMRVGSDMVRGVSEADVDRTTADGKASSVQFIHFPFTDAQVATFRTPGTEIVLGFDHPAYGHMSIMPENVRAALAEDFAD